MADDWRVRLSFEEADAATRQAGMLEAAEIGEDVARRMGDRIVVSNDGPELFLYADTEDAARAAYDFVRSDLSASGPQPTVELSRWHDEAEDWEPADEPLPTTEAERAAERARLMRQEDRDSVRRGFAEWEVRVALPTLHDARALSKRLEAEGVAHVRRWRSVLVGAPDEDAAREWSERLRGDAPAGTEVSVEGTLAAVERNNPFAFLTGLGGGP